MSGTRTKKKLTWEDVAIIRLRASKGDGASFIAEDYPVDRSTVAHVIAGDTWRGPS